MSEKAQKIWIRKKFDEAKSAAPAAQVQPSAANPAAPKGGKSSKAKFGTHGLIKHKMRSGRVFAAVQADLPQQTYEHKEPAAKAADEYAAEDYAIDEQYEGETYTDDYYDDELEAAQYVAAQADDETTEDEDTDHGDYDACEHEAAQFASKWDNQLDPGTPEEQFADGWDRQFSYMQRSTEEPRAPVPHPDRLRRSAKDKPINWQAGRPARARLATRHSAHTQK
jgi:hypothetical protein